MSKVKIGIIGVGNISNAHINAYLNNPDAELYAFCDINAERLKEMGEKYGVTRLFTDKDEMLKLSEIDAVSVCTWNSEHAPCSIAALNAGKHVLCEKPMATTVEDAIAMKETTAILSETSILLTIWEIFIMPRLHICAETAIPAVGSGTNPVRQEVLLLTLVFM